MSLEDAPGVGRVKQVRRAACRRAENVKGRDKIILSLYTVALLALPVVAGLDAGRFHWSDVRPVAQALGLIGLLPVGLWLFWVTRTNCRGTRSTRSACAIVAFRASGRRQVQTA